MPSHTNFVIFYHLGTCVKQSELIGLSASTKFLRQWPHCMSTQEVAPTFTIPCSSSTSRWQCADKPLQLGQTQMSPFLIKALTLACLRFSLAVIVIALFSDIDPTMRSLIFWHAGISP